MSRLTRLTLALALAAGLPAAAADPPGGKRYALLVGVQRYGEGTGLRNLDYPERDVADLAAVLTRLGYRVTVLTRSEAVKQDTDFLRPTADNIRDHLARLAGACGPADTLLVGLSGHGAHLKATDQLYFCPADTRLTRPDSLVGIDEVLALLGTGTCRAGSKVLLVDACRNDPMDGASVAPPAELKSSTRPLVPDRPGGTVALFSCSRGQISHESTRHKHGFLFHHVIEGLQGKAANPKTGEVTWLGLARYVREELPPAVTAEKGPRVVQIPEVWGTDHGLVLFPGDRPAPPPPAAGPAPAAGSRASRYSRSRSRSSAPARAEPPIKSAPPARPEPPPARPVPNNFAADVGEVNRLLMAGTGVAAYFAAVDAGKVQRWRLAAVTGDPGAQFLYARCLATGTGGMARDPAAAATWYRKAADLGQPLAQTSLGMCYLEGAGVKKDAKEGVRWHRKAADQGCPDAQHNLAECYYHGTGVSKDLKAALSWFRKAADQGHALALTDLGACYHDGTGVKKDAREAVRYYRQAAELGCAEAQYDLAECYYHGTGVAKDSAAAVAWFRIAADQGHAEAQLSLGACYHDGTGVKKNVPEAIKWYRLAAAQGNKKAKEHLARLHVRS